MSKLIKNIVFVAFMVLCAGTFVLFEQTDCTWLLDCTIWSLVGAVISAMVCDVKEDGAE